MGKISKRSFAGAPDKRWWQFRFPSFWGADILQIAEAFTALGYGADPRLSPVLALIRGKQDEDGRWPLEYIDYSHKMWVKYGSLNKPNKWVTLRAMRALQWAGMIDKSGRPVKMIAANRKEATRWT